MKDRGQAAVPPAVQSRVGPDVEGAVARGEQGPDSIVLQAVGGPQVAHDAIAVEEVDAALDGGGGQGERKSVG